MYSGQVQPVSRILPGATWARESAQVLTANNPNANGENKFISIAWAQNEARDGARDYNNRKRNAQDDAEENLEVSAVP
jgi:hypothetical protein